jgi:uncharacterized protein YegP (UPF0339 family)
MTKARVKWNGSQYFVRVVASNGAILAHSEQYRNKTDALNCARLIAGGGSVSDDT